MSAAKRKKVKAEVWNSSIQGEMWALPATPEAYDAMVEQMKVAYCSTPTETFQDGMKVALRAIGISRPKDSTRNKETRK